MTANTQIDDNKLFVYNHNNRWCLAVSVVNFEIHYYENYLGGIIEIDEMNFMNLLSVNLEFYAVLEFVKRIEHFIEYGE